MKPADYKKRIRDLFDKMNQHEAEMQRKAGVGEYDQKSFLRDMAISLDYLQQYTDILGEITQDEEALKCQTH